MKEALQLIIYYVFLIICEALQGYKLKIQRVSDYHSK